MITKRISMVDFGWTSQGDLELFNGDIADTVNTVGKAFIQEVGDRIRSSQGEWTMYPTRGADIDQFIGEINDREVRDGISDSIKFALTKDSFLTRNDFTILVARVATTEVAIRIDFDTSLVDVEPHSSLQFNVLYDTDGKGPFIIR